MISRIKVSIQQLGDFLGSARLPDLIQGSRNVCVQTTRISSYCFHASQDGFTPIGIGFTSLCAKDGVFEMTSPMKLKPQNKRGRTSMHYSLMAATGVRFSIGRNLRARAPV